MCLPPAVKEASYLRQMVKEDLCLAPVEHCLVMVTRRVLELVKGVL